MKMSQFKSLLIIYLFLSSPVIFAEDSTYVSMNEARALKRLKVSYSGKTSEGNSYNLYAVRCKNHWVYTIADSSFFYSLLQTKRNGELIENSAFFTTGINKIMESKLYKVKNKKRRKKKAEFTLDCYYNLNSKGRKLYKSLVYLENKSKVSVIPAGIDFAEYEKKINDTNTKGRRAQSRIRRFQRLEKKMKKKLGSIL